MDTPYFNPNFLHYKGSRSSIADFFPEKPGSYFGEEKKKSHVVDSDRIDDIPARPAVLVIDESSYTHHRIRLFLQELCQIDTAYTMEAAAALLGEGSYRIVFVSSEVEDARSLEMQLDFIRTRHSHTNADIYAFLPPNQQIGAYRLKSLGFTDGFVKPINPWTVRRIVQDAIQHHP